MIIEKCTKCGKLTSRPIATETVGKFLCPECAEEEHPWPGLGYGFGGLK